MVNDPETAETIRTTFALLKSKIRQYILLEGIALVIACAGAIFWLMFGLDVVWFKVNRFELPREVRQVLLFGSLIMLAIVALRVIFQRMFIPFRDRSVAMLMEQKFPRLSDRLITTVEQLESRETDAPPLTRMMLRQTAQEAYEMLKNLDIRSVFDQAPLRRVTALAGVMLVSVGILLAVDAPAMGRWVDGFVRLKDEYWVRQTSVSIRVLRQPGDEVREFVDHRIKHARGQDLTLLVDLSDESPIPERVMLTYRTKNGTSSRVVMSHPQERQFQQTISEVVDDLSLWVVAGDYRNRLPYEIVVVDPPRIDSAELLCQYPAYTGLNRPSEGGLTRQEILGVSTLVPVGTKFFLKGKSNKELSRISIRSNRFELFHAMDGKSSGAGDRVILESEDGDEEIIVPVTPAMFSHAGIERSPKEMLVGMEMTNDLEKANASFISSPEYLPLSGETLLLIQLEDQDGVRSTEPVRLILGGIVDELPEVTAELKGIGKAITMRADVPIRVQVSDDYGLAEVKYRFATGGKIDQEPSTRPIAENLNGKREWETTDLNSRGVVNFEVLPLNLPLGETFQLLVEASDQNTVSGPGIGTSSLFSFKIVSPEELLSGLYQDELNLRKRYEQMIADLEKTLDDVKVHREKYRNEKTADDQMPDELKSAVSACVERTLYSLRQNATENASVTSAFEDIRAQLINNHVDTPQILDRVSNQILKPLEEINRVSFPQADERLGELRSGLTRNMDLKDSLTASVISIEDLLTAMQRVLGEMRKLESFHEAIELLKGIIDDESKLKNSVNEKNKTSLIDDLFK